MPEQKRHFTRAEIEAKVLKTLESTLSSEKSMRILDVELLSFPLFHPSQATHVPPIWLVRYEKDLAACDVKYENTVVLTERCLSTGESRLDYLIGCELPKGCSSCTEEDDHMKKERALYA